MYGINSRQPNPLLSKRKLSKLAELKYLYGKAATSQKHELVRMVFDNRLYYEKGSYRTPYILPILESNLLRNNQLEELILDKKGENIAAFPLKWRCGESNPGPEQGKPAPSTCLSVIRFSSQTRCTADPRLSLRY